MVKSATGINGPDLSGQVLGVYELQALIGAGGMGTVYRAYQPSMKREVAIKVLPPSLALSPEYLERFNREAEIIARLEHPHIVPVYDYGTENGFTFVAMRLIPGGSLAQRMKRYGIPSLSETRDLYQQLASALDYAHRQSVIHRDVKPGNVLVDYEGNAYLADFGIAKLVGSTVMTQGAGIGTAAYIAPEVALGKPFDGRADVYALGVMLFGLLTGRPPYQADSKDALIYQHIHEPIPLPRQHKPSLPERLDAVITRAMAKEADQRYPTCKALADDLAAAINDAPPDEREESPTGFFTMPLPPSPVPVLRSVGTTPLMSAAAQNNRAGHWSLWLLGVLSALTLGALVLAAYLLLRPAPEDNNTSAGSQEIDLSARVEFAIQSTRLVETQTALHATQTAVSLAPVSDEDDESALITAAGVDAGTPSPEPLSEEGSPSPLGTLPAGAANTEWTPVVTDFNGQSMVLVPGGCTVIGSEDGEPDERPTREVCLDPFWIGQTEVTNTQYALCVAAGECRPPTDRRYFDDPAYAEHPVVFVSWDDAAHYAAWLGVQLPTAAQWEYAARGPAGWPYAWGADQPSCEAANIAGCVGDTAPVGLERRQAGASWVHALDMIGNVREWVADWYTPDYYDALAPGTHNPPGPPDGTVRTVRGGAWDSEAGQVRASDREGVGPDYTDATLGFRIAAPGVS